MIKLVLIKNFFTLTENLKCFSMQALMYYSHTCTDSFWGILLEDTLARVALPPELSHSKVFWEHLNMKSRRLLGSFHISSADVLI